MQAGADSSEAFENAMRNEGLIDLPGEDESAEDSFAAEASRFRLEADDEAWRESLPPQWESDLDSCDDDLIDDSAREEHPLQQLASDLYLRVSKLMEAASDQRSSHVETLMHGLGEIAGGLTQALTDRETQIDGLHRGLALVQLKRALRGASFARGALFPLRAAALLKQDEFDV